jgi:hypothetical protein
LAFVISKWKKGIEEYKKTNRRKGKKATED